MILVADKELYNKKNLQQRKRGCHNVLRKLKCQTSFIWYKEKLINRRYNMHSNG